MFAATKIHKWRYQAVTRITLISLACFLLVCNAFGASLLDEALESFREGDYGRAQTVLEEILQRPSPPQEDAAMFLLIEVHLARRNATDAVEVADRLIKRFPESSYLDDAHYARAEALFLQKELIASAQELVWVIENAQDNRLREKALKVLPRLGERSTTKQERKQLEQIAVQVPVTPQIPQGAVVVLLAFPEEEMPEALALKQSIEFAVEHGSVRFPVVFRDVTSSLECAQAAQEVLSGKMVRLLLFAGDEGSATALALLSDKYQVPVLMLTGYAHSLTNLSDYVFEFLPSRFTQSQALAEFAVKDLKIHSFLELADSNEEGRALEEGFRQSATAAGGVIEASEWYPQSAVSIRASLRNLFSTLPGGAQGDRELGAAVSDSELNTLWGTGNSEVLLLGKEDSLKPPRAAHEALFLAIPSGRAADMASQISTLLGNRILLGNSAWIDPEALQEFPEIDGNLIVAAPLLPDVEAEDGLQQLYEDSCQRKCSLWELLGLDAAAFVGNVMAGQPDSPQQVYQTLRSSPVFTGVSVQLDFHEGRENRAVRILRYEEGAFTVLK
jgi:tetratricopeptide (TPR) repeat protein